MIRRMLILGVVALALFVPAAHAQYNPDPTGGTVSDSTVTAGDTVTLTVTGFPANGHVDVFFESDPVFLGSFPTDAEGSATIEVTIPATADCGAHNLRILGFEPDYPHSDGHWNSDPVAQELVIPITVGGAGCETAGALPRTGTDSSLPLAKIAIVLIAAGGLLIVAARDRSKKATA